MRSHSESPSANNELPSHVMIRDIILLPQEPEAKKVCGEFTGLHMRIPDDLLDESISRLYNTIKYIAEFAAAQHIQINFTNNGEMQPLKENDITRLITPEFSFYTIKPLSLSQFEFLMDHVAEIAKDLPNNLHLVLGSFAVLTPDDKLMNVFAYIQCGQLFSMQLTVKNYFSSIDPVYMKHLENGLLKPIKNINADKDRIFDLSIQVDNLTYYFSFQNILICETLARQKFFTCVEICLDHLLGIGKKYTSFSNHKKNGFPKQISHIIVANTVHLHPVNILGLVTIADPRWSTYFGFRIQGNAQEIREFPSEQMFGQSLTCFVTDASPCADFEVLQNTRMPIRYGVELLENALSKLKVFIEEDNNDKASLTVELLLSDFNALNALLAQPIAEFLVKRVEEILSIESYRKLIDQLGELSESVATKAPKSAIIYKLKMANALLMSLNDDISYRKNLSRTENKLNPQEMTASKQRPPRGQSALFTTATSSSTQNPPEKNKKRPRS